MMCQVNEERGDFEEKKWNHIADRVHAYHFKPLFSVTGVGST